MIETRQDIEEMTIKPFLVILERFMRFQDVNVADLIASAIVTGDRSQKRERQGFHFSM
jgi:hypothetical protein